VAAASITGQLRTPSGWQYSVQAAGRRFTVTVSNDYHSKLAHKFHHPRDLVAAAFGFLLTREPAQNILESFDLEDIEKYFPEFPGSIA
jgi:hypothetical protein